ncbi:MAG: gluconokinase, GntK/IdnK-type [Cyanobacteria bacterium P01_H01_bin.15]
MTVNKFPLVWVLIGVAGSGKSTVGRLLSERLQIDFIEGDLRHSRYNIRKMQAQIPLEDVERQQWLNAIAADIKRAVVSERGMVVTCSALKRAYRERIVSAGQVQLIWLNVPESELRKRLNQRTNHYLKADLLPSQLDAFETIDPQENIWIVDGCLSPQAIVDSLMDKIIANFSVMANPWWQRY